MKKYTESKVLSIDVGLTNLGIVLMHHEVVAGFTLQICENLSVFQAVPQRLTDDKLCEALITCFETFFQVHSELLKDIRVLAVERQWKSGRMTKVSHFLSMLLKTRYPTAQLQFVAPVEKLRVLGLPSKSGVEEAEADYENEEFVTGDGERDSERESEGTEIKGTKKRMKSAKTKSKKTKKDAGAAYRARKKLAIEHTRIALQGLPIHDPTGAYDRLLKNKPDPCDALLQSLYIFKKTGLQVRPRTS